MPERSSLCKFNFDADYWIVSLIRAKRSNGSPTNHAQIIVEGINASGEIFRKLAEFGGPSSLYSEEPNSYCSMGRMGKVRGFRDLPSVFNIAAGTCWRRKSGAVKTMMDAINAEHGKQLPFHILGRDSALNSLLASTVGGLGAGVLGGMANLFGLALITVLSGGAEVPLSLATILFGGNVVTFTAIGAMDHRTGDNCATWAANKLKLAGIFVEFSALRYLFNYTPEITDNSIPSLSP